MATNKVVYGNQTLIDLTADTVAEQTLLLGATAHTKSGEIITGKCDFDSNTKDATANVSEILVGQTAYVNGAKITGTMANRGDASGVIADKSDVYTIQSGFHDGSGTVKIDDVEKAKIIAGNIKAGVSILGVEGTYAGGGSKTQSKSATPYTTAQTILPDDGFDGLSQVSIDAIHYEETTNSAGGTTVTIGTVAPV